MTDEATFITLNENHPVLHCTARIHVIEGVSVTVDLMDFGNSLAVDQILDFCKTTFTNVIDNMLENHQRISMKIAATVHLQKQSGEAVPFVDIGSDSVFLYRHKHQRNVAIHKQLLKISNPQHYRETYGGVTIDGDTSGSAYAVTTSFNTIRLVITTPLVHNPRALKTNLRLIANQKFTRHIDFLPYNNDKFCFMHSLYYALYEIPKPEQFRNLCNNKEYMTGFNNFMKEYRLEEFYEDDRLVLDNIVLIEERLKASINIYHVGNPGEPVELHYRSNFKYESDSPINLLLLPISCFENTRKDGKQPAHGEAIRQNLDPELCDASKAILRAACLEYTDSIESHCVVLNKSYFSKFKGGKVCRYCHVTKQKDTKIDVHEVNCRQHHQGISLKERIRNYKETKHPLKIFDRFSAFYQTPFCCYDFETRIVREMVNNKIFNKHVPFSYAILYLNIFSLKDSILKLESSENPEELLEWFRADCKEITRHHHDVVQSVHHAENRPRLTEEIRNAGCPFCLKPYSEENPPEYNHSHFQNDTLNAHLNKYICLKCNRKAMVRNTPLSFYAHNASKYDQNLWLPGFLNDPEITSHEFLNKTESRFTEVKLGFGYKNKMGKSKYKMTFRDSLLLLAGPLAGHIRAWVSPKDRSALKELMTLFYQNIDDSKLEKLVDISFKKQVFPYTALDNTELLTSKEPIPKEYFKSTFIPDAEADSTDEFVGEDCSESEYQEYLAAKAVLDVTTGKTFLDMHDFYLLLDVVLLAIVLKNFSEVNYNLTGVNPLAYLSTSAYSFGSMLKHNLYSENKIPTLNIPEIDVQQFVKRSIRGGFTFAFNKTNLRGENNVTFGSDFTSLYPTIMNLQKLPYEFKEWLDLSSKTTSEILKEIFDTDDSLYHFIECDIAPLAAEHQDKVSCYPMFPETQTISANDYSQDQVFRFCTNNGANTFGDQTLNTVSFYEKRNYITSKGYLRQAIEVGYQVTKIHRVAVFHADFVLKEYIDKVYALKRDGTARCNEIESLIAAGDLTQEEVAKLKDELITLKTKVGGVYKLILNAIFGFSIINSDKHKEAELFEIEKQKDMLIKRISSPRFLGMLRVGDRMVLNQQKASYTMDSPLMIGSAILIESKLMTARYIFSLYEYLAKLGEGLALHPIYMDTDSVYLSIRNFRREFKSIPDFISRFNNEVYKLFDTSLSPAELQDPSTHNQLGFMTLEAGGEEITDFAVVGSKCYSYKYSKQVTKGKGISKTLASRLLSYDLYQSIVDGSIFEDFTREKYSVSYREFRTRGFQVNTISSAKQFVTLVDLKSYYPHNSPEYAIFGSEKHKTLLAAENMEIF